ncbi:hypothetical protein [Citrobacter freundii]|uniref:hypothetical protein n=1 Tax=Citrobacter freundii TaxID=546 RepID=UPI0019035A38|nr:hypothetical protein [Citrobacter freundii]MBJ8931650.1 hypothetical protein [Citrobacter freundii]
MLKVIILYSYTDIMAKPWLENDFEVWSFDGKHPPGITREGNHVKVGMYFDAYDTNRHVKEIISIVGDGVCMVFGFPECTHLANSGSKHFAKKYAENPAFQAEAVELARMVMYLGNELSVPWGLENPMGALSTIWRRYDFTFHPYEYGCYLPINDVHPLYPEVIPARDAYTKLTCIYYGNGFFQPIKKPVHRDLVNPIMKNNVVPHNSGETTRYSPQYNRLGGGSSRTKEIRSATPRGFSEAVYLAHCGYLRRRFGIRVSAEPISPL